MAAAETWRRVWGDGKIFRGPRFQNYDFLRRKIFIFTPKISDDLFLKEFLNKTIFYSVHPFAHIQQHYFSKYWGDQCMGRPLTSIFFGGASPSPLPRSPPLANGYLNLRVASVLRLSPRLFAARCSLTVDRSPPLGSPVPTPHSPLPTPLDSSF